MPGGMEERRGRGMRWFGFEKKEGGIGMGPIRICVLGVVVVVGSGLGGLDLDLDLDFMLLVVLLGKRRYFCFVFENE